PVPRPDFIFFRIQVLFPARDGGRLTELEAGVDAVNRGKGGGENRADHEGWTAAFLEEFGVDVRGVDEEVAAVVLPHRPGGELGQVLLQLPLEVAPGEVGVRLGETRLRQR